MSTFTVYLRLGFEHLLDLQGYDHILFLAVLCAAYTLARWRELLVLVTAFTIGHSVSLAVATLRLVRVDTGLVEFLIPVTIVATAVTNLAGLRREDPAEHKVAARPLRYALALVFGVVHGLGFSNFLRLALGEERSLFVPLLSFNIGLELAQIVVAVGVVAVALVAVRFLSLPQRVWTLLLSALAGGLAAVMAVQRWPF
ncbi:MAG: HupE/UreJ family protein [Gemmatimonadetes bacterium]|nr:HupE/UreJ family protein [Gemmatimonadota bacterium]MYI46395.1 HupE/UreJ family protein [Gemmatimonadota bacterium]